MRKLCFFIRILDYEGIIYEDGTKEYWFYTNYRIFGKRQYLVAGKAGHVTRPVPIRQPVINVSRVGARRRWKHVTAHIFVNKAADPDLHGSAFMQDLNREIQVANCRKFEKSQNKRLKILWHFPFFPFKWSTQLFKCERLNYRKS